MLNIQLYKRSKYSTALSLSMVNLVPDTSILPGKRCLYNVGGSTLEIFVLDKSSCSTDNWRQWRLARSLITCQQSQRFWCAPPTSFPRGNRKKLSLHDAERVEEFVDGTMINLIWNGEWIFTTKSCIGGQNYFYRVEDPMSFKEMFLTKKR